MRLINSAKKASFIAIKLTRTLSTVSLLENAKIFVVIDSERQNNIIGVKKYPFPGDVSSKVAIANNDISSFVVQENALKKGFLLTEALEPTDGDVQRMPDLSEQRNTELQAMDCPRLLRNDLVELFPTIDLSTRPMSVINWTEKTKSDMSSWSMTMEVERLQLTGAFIERAKRICESLNAAGHWADFIDPSSGKPYLSGHTNATLVDTDHRYNDLGFIVTDLGCCKVLEHLEWGSSVFVGTIFTDAPTNSNIVKQIVFTSDKN